MCIRRSSTNSKTERGIYVKHFKNIPMADMEIVLVSSLLCMCCGFLAFLLFVSCVDAENLTLGIYF